MPFAAFVKDSLTYVPSSLIKSTTAPQEVYSAMVPKVGGTTSLGAVEGSG